MKTGSQKGKTFANTNRSSFFQQKQIKNISYQLSVKCPQYFKDSVAADLIQYYCNEPQDKCFMICSSLTRAQKLHASEYLSKHCELIHSEMDRRQKIRKAKVFEQTNQKKCLVTNCVNNSHLRKFKVKLVIFVSPPKNYYFYQQILNCFQSVEYAIVCYSTKQIQNFCAFQQEIQRKFIMMVPPDVQSQSQDQQQQPKYKYPKQYQNTKNDDKQRYEQKPNRQRNRQVNNFNQVPLKVVVKNVNLQNEQSDLQRLLDDNNICTTQVRLIYPKSTVNIDYKQLTKTGFITFPDQANYQACLKLDGTLLSGNTLRIQKYAPRNR